MACLCLNIQQKQHLRVGVFGKRTFPSSLTFSVIAVEIFAILNHKGDRTDSCLSLLV